MRTRNTIRLIAVVTSVCVWTQAARAENWSVKPRPSGHRKLAPELDVLRHCKSCFKGMGRNGKAVFEVPNTQRVAMQTMAMSIDAGETAVQKKSKRLIIRYASSQQKPSDDTLRAAGLSTVEDYEHGEFLVVEPTEDVSSKTVEALISDDAILHASPDYVMGVTPIKTGVSIAEASTAAVPNDPLFNKLWGLTNIGATQVWPTINSSPKVIVAVIDTGVDYKHPDLKDNMWSKNGKYGFDFYDDDDDPMDEQNHGTHCAGTIAGVGNNGVGVVGVSWQTQIMALRFLGPDGTGNLSDAVKAIDFAIANGAHIISNSWAGPTTEFTLDEAIARAEKKGILFVAAAGNTAGKGNNNDVNPYYPANCRSLNMITVGAIDVNNQRGSFSHYGKQSVDIGAPGVAIVSTVRNGQYAQYDGTSMATPHVAGAAALVWAKTFPTPIQDKDQMVKVRDLILSNARPVPALKGFWGEAPPAKVSGGVLDITFLKSTVDQVPPSNPNSTPNPVRRIVENRMKVDPAKLR